MSVNVTTDKSLFKSCACSRAVLLHEQISKTSNMKKEKEKEKRTASKWQPTQLEQKLIRNTMHFLPSISKESGRDLLAFVEN